MARYAGSNYDPGMADPLAPIRAVLCELDADDLDLLHATSATPIAPSTVLLSWIEHAWDWETMRRRGFEFALAPLEDAIRPSELPAALNAAKALFAEYGSAGGNVPRFFSGLLALLLDMQWRQ
jgi:hypothetical protein